MEYYVAYLITCEPYLELKADCAQIRGCFFGAREGGVLFCHHDNKHLH